LSGRFIAIEAPVFPVNSSDEHIVLFLPHATHVMESHVVFYQSFTWILQEYGGVIFLVSYNIYDISCHVIKKEGDPISDD